jgi:hypothetical protein
MGRVGEEMVAGTRQARQDEEFRIKGTGTRGKNEEGMV